jgi:hypothetical protein
MANTHPETALEPNASANGAQEQHGPTVREGEARVSDRALRVARV